MQTSPGPNLQAGVIIIGNEILSGRTQDVNLSFLGRKLNSLGIQLAEGRIIPDVEPVIVETINTFRQSYTYVFTTGGIGPTHDDITTKAVGKAFNREVKLHDGAMARLNRRYEDHDLTEARIKMAHIPENAELIDNPVSDAPGFSIDNVFVLAGVPEIMRAMFDNIAPRLRTGKPIVSQTVRCYLGEGVIAAGLEAIQTAHPSIDIGSYPYWQKKYAGTSVVARGINEEELAVVVQKIAKLIRDFGQDPIFEPKD